MSWTWSGAGSGAAAGAVGGSAFGPFGTIAGGLAGGLMGGFSGGSQGMSRGRARYAQKLTNEFNETALGYYRKHPPHKFIQSRVKDARAAGIHPLFALGAGISSSPSLQTPSSFARDAVGGATFDASGIGRTGGSPRGLRGLERRAAEVGVRKTESEIGLTDALRAKAIQEANYWRNKTVVPDTDLSGVPRPRARPYLTDVTGQKVLIPRGDPAEAWEREFGDAGGTLMGLDRFLGAEGMESYRGRPSRPGYSRKYSPAPR